ncbi:MAG TPA: HEAT repeat domain-containing protein [Aggregatilineaceae bacterium]|nr:HEAT repeat domain-containing protein [Aggregatilineaceae bacterium]
MDDQPTLEQLLHQLTEGDMHTSIAAHIQLMKLGEPAVEPLISIVQNPEKKELWWLAADALGHMGDRRAIEPLIDLLKNPLSFDAILARKYTVWALAKLPDPKAVDVLIEMLHEVNSIVDDGVIEYEPDIETISAAISALTEIGDLRALQPILDRFLEDDHYWEDGEFLRDWGEPAFNLLLEMLKSDNPTKRDVAAGLVGELGNLDAVEPLLETLKTDEDGEVRSSAAYALGRLGDSRAFDELLNALNDSNKHIRLSALYGLAGLQDKRAVEPLLEMLQTYDDQEVRQGVIYTLGQLRDSRTFNVLVNALDDPKNYIRGLAVEGLAGLKDKRAIESLTQIMNGTVPDLAQKAKYALEMFKE